MGRKKSYDRDDLVGKAVHIFREHGFAGTSAEMLVRQLGVNRYGLYAEFGSKQGLFDAALQRYDDEVIERNFGPLEAPGSGLAEIRELLAFFAAATGGPVAGRGCLLCNTAVEFGPNDPSGAGFVQRYLERISRAFLAALEGAASRGEVGLHVDPRAEAALLSASVLGMFVMLRANAPRDLVEDAAHVAIERLDGLRGERSPG